MLLLLWGTPLMEILIGTLKKPFGALLTQMCFHCWGCTEGGAEPSPAREQGHGWAATLSAPILPFLTPD